MTYKIVVPLNDSPATWDAVAFAADLGQKAHARLVFVHVVALNPPMPLPGLDHLEKSYNMDIQAKASRELDVCRARLAADYAGRVSYELVDVEGEGEVAPVIVEYLNQSHPDTNLVVVGSRNLSGIRKWVEGSVSGEHLDVPADFPATCLMDFSFFILIVIPCYSIPPHPTDGSEYLVHNLPYPVTIVKGHPNVAHPHAPAAATANHTKAS